MSRGCWTSQQQQSCDCDTSMYGDGKLKPEHFSRTTIEAERALLGALLLNNEIFYRLDPVLKPHHFSDPAHSRIFDLAARRIKKNALASPVTLKPFLADDEQLKDLGGTKYLALLAAHSRDGVVTGNVLETILNQRSRKPQDNWTTNQPRDKWRSCEHLADSILFFVAKPGDAEVILGDLLEELAKVRKCKSDRFAQSWFWWEIFWIVVNQGSARALENPAIKRLLDACIERFKR